MDENTNRPFSGLFRGFARVWTPVALASELRGAGPLGLHVGGEPVVVFRGEGGRLGALIDRCPHRGVALSLGRVEEGCLRCPFHGWRFGPEGANHHVPWNPEAKRELLGAIGVPVREVGGLLWLYTAAGEAEGEPETIDELTDPKVRKHGEVFEWSAHWTRVMDNMLDDTHLPFVHGRTIGRQMLQRPDARLDLDWHERPWGAEWTVSVDGERRGGSAEFRWPNVVVVRVPVPGKRLAILLAAVPAAAGRVRVLQVGLRDFGRTLALDPLFTWFNRRVLEEDRAIVESSPDEVRPPGQERSVRTDAPGLYFRKRYASELRDHSARPGPRSLPTVNRGEG